MSFKRTETRGARGPNRAIGNVSRRTALRPRHRRPSGEPSLFDRVRLICIIAGGAWVLSVLITRVINPPITSLVVIRQAQSLIASHAGLKEWRWIRLRDLPMHVLQAVVTAEDARFMMHRGVDLLAVGDAIDAAGGRRKLRGASTITMQTVKNIYLWPGRSYIRKVIEWIMAPIAGAMWGKRRTLELYLNVIEWGEGIYGIESAARHYYHKSASVLSPHEAAALAAILPNPRRLSPISMVQSTKRRYLRVMKEYQGTQVPR